jgi:hypothetical protein
MHPQASMGAVKASMRLTTTEIKTEQIGPGKQHSMGSHYSTAYCPLTKDKGSGQKTAYRLALFQSQ